MKKLLGFFAVCMLLSASGFAAKIIVTGQPIILKQQDGLYVVPEGYTMKEYAYTNIDGVDYVCYLTPQTTLASLDNKTVQVTVGGVQANWNCYVYDRNNTTYFGP